jgi:hypothetical protein
LRIALENELPNHRCVAQIAPSNDIVLYGKIVINLESTAVHVSVRGYTSEDLYVITIPVPEAHPSISSPRIHPKPASARSLFGDVKRILTR